MPTIEELIGEETEAKSAQLKAKELTAAECSRYTFLECLFEDARRRGIEPRMPTPEENKNGTARFLQLIKLRIKTTSSNNLPEIESIEELETATIPEPEEIVSGVLHKGSKGVLGGSSKGRKTWVLMDLAISVATGAKWLGFKTKPGRVLYVNFELQRFFFRKRHRLIKEAKQIKTPIPNLDVLNLRGYSASASEIIPKIKERIEDKDYSLIILDPTYKMLPKDKSENDTHVIAEMLNEFERLSVQTEAAVFFAAHFAKGNSVAKSAIDRISGSGVFARDPDSIITMTENDDQGAKDAFTLSFILRNFRPVDEFVIQWDKWTFARNDNLDPKKLKEPNKTKKCTEEQVLAAMGSKEWGYGELFKHLKDLGISIGDSTFNRLLGSLKRSGRAYKSELNDKWSLTAAEMEKRQGGSGGEDEVE